ILTGFFLYRHANWFAVHLILEAQCTPLLKILAISVPFGVFHSCVNGYYLARKKLSIPAAAQLIEQCFRVAASFLLFSIWSEKGIAITPKLAVFGLLAGELAAWLFTGFMILWDFCKGRYHLTSMTKPLKELKAIVALSLPLTCNRLLVNILHSIEAVLIPGHLQLFGLDNASALSIYGVLTGMALPLILFPSAVTNALSTVLLPSVAENQALGKQENIRKSILLSIKYCLLLGFSAFLFFYAGGNLLGLLLFKNEFAGTFIKTLSFICPCLYLSGTLNGILNGLGAANQTFWLNTLGLGIRLLFVFFIIPHYGIVGYLWGLIISELFITLLSLYCLREFLFICSR
ncbi:MAG: polysaccharide biosynthesis C-terminal domain-containing protein, partial [Blautia sp.]|nr:polysaccharide biosynthesis C-terminal domain-containing protein [Blautia sp.]